MDILKVYVLLLISIISTVCFCGLTHAGNDTRRKKAAFKITPKSWPKEVVKNGNTRTTTEEAPITGGSNGKKKAPKQAKVAVSIRLPLFNEVINKYHVNQKPTAESFGPRIDALRPDEVGKAINFARYELTNHSTLPYKEQVDEVMNITEQKHDDGALYHIKLRLNKSDCKRENSSCDPYFDSTFMQSEEAQIIAPLESPLKPGTVIEVYGSIPMQSKGFHITLQTGYQRPVEAQLRLKAKFPRTGTEIQLQYFDGQWNLYNHHKGFLETKTSFTIMIVCLASRFEIYINDVSFASFNHVLPYEDTTHVSIFGDVSITKVSGIGSFLPIEAFNPVKYVPFVAPLAAPLASGMSISVKGIIPTYSERFAITIQNGSDLEPTKAPFRMLVAFNDRKSTISFWYFDGTWKDEQVANHAVTSGGPFHIVVTCRTGYFQISIDNKEIAKYDYRVQVPYSNATHLSVIGMVNVTEVVGIGELPFVKPLDQPAHTPYVVPLTNITLALGQKFRIWAYLQESVNVWMSLENPKHSVSYIVLNITGNAAKQTPRFSFNTVERKKWGKLVGPIRPTWLKTNQPIQMEISCLEKSFKVTFYGIWTYFFDYRMPVTNEAATLRFYNTGMVIHAVDGPSAEQELRLSQPPAFRTCEVNVWSRSARQEMWLNHFACKQVFST